MLIHYFLASGWGILIFLTFMGWGAATVRALGLRDLVGPGTTGIAGISVLVLLGGLLNLLRLISPALIIGCVVTGDLFSIIDLYGRRHGVTARLAELAGALRSDLVAMGLMGVIICGTLLRCTAVINEAPANKWDDHQAYYVFPEKMLQTGTMGPDPFSERRCASGLGGMSFLHTLPLSMLGFRSIELVDAAACFVLSVVIVFELSSQLGLRLRSACCAAALLVLMPSYWNNSTAQTAVTAFLLAAVTLAAIEPRDSALRLDLLIGLILGALCTLKSNVIPWAAVFGFLYVLLQRNGGSFKTTGLRLFLIGCVVGGIMLPWMIAMRQSSGTFLYPLFGKGYMGPPYSLVPSPSRYMTPTLFAQVIARVIPEIICIVVLIGAWRASTARSTFALRTMAAAAAATLFGTLAIGYAVGGRGATRYSLSMLLAGWVLIVILFFYFRERVDLCTTGRLNRWVLGLMTLFFFSLTFWVEGGWPSYYRHMAQLSESGLADGPLYGSEMRSEYLSMQYRVPPGAVLLTRLSMPPVLDFRRNRIYIMDWPNWSWPPPGLPDLRDGEQLLRYLHQLSIRYVAYSYADECGMKGWEKRLALSRWDDDLHRQTMVFQGALMQLANDRRVIYDDGSIILIDLESTSSPAQKDR